MIRTLQNIYLSLTGMPANLVCLFISTVHFRRRKEKKKPSEKAQENTLLSFLRHDKHFFHS